VNNRREGDFDCGFGEIQTTAWNNFPFKYEIAVMESENENAKGCEALELYNTT